MNNDFLSLVEEAKALNSSIFSLTRMQLLSNLETVGKDGVTYRELKAAMRVDDGALFSNLKALEEMGYAKKQTITLEGKQLESYQITSEGRLEWQRAKGWLKKFLEFGGEKNES